MISSLNLMKHQPLSKMKREKYSRMTCLIIVKNIIVTIKLEIKIKENVNRRILNIKIDITNIY